MEKGEIVCDMPPLEAIRRRALENLSQLPDKYKRLRKAPRYPVELSPALRKLMKELTNDLKKIEAESNA